MNRRRKHLYGLVIGIGLAAVVADRFMGLGVTGEPAEADAAGGLVVNSEAAGAADDAGAIVAAAAPFPRSLPAAPSPQWSRDLFAVPPSALEAFGIVVSETGAVQGPGADAAAVPSRAEQFIGRHRLSAVMINGSSRLVVLDDDQMIEIGQAMDGCTLTAVDDAAAVFDCGDGAARLEIESELMDIPH